MVKWVVVKWQMDSGQVAGGSGQAAGGWWSSGRWAVVKWQMDSGQVADLQWSSESVNSGQVTSCTVGKV